MLRKCLAATVAVLSITGMGSAIHAAVIVEETQLFGENQDDGSVTLSLTDFTLKDDDLLVVSFSQ